MFFIIIMILITLSLAGSAAFFSIYGLAAIFSGAFIPVIIMGSSLEAGKLVAASYVYRFWDRISFLMKSYLILAVVVLMVITSAGIFGFLSAAYQESAMQLKQLNTKIETLQERLETLEEKKAKLDETLARMPENYVTKRENFISSEQYQRTTKQIDKAEQKLHEAKVEKINTEVHTGPITYIADAFETDIDNATKYMLLMIIFAFDPLAVVLTIGVNVALLERKKDKQAKKQQEQTDEPDPSIAQPEDLNSVIDVPQSEYHDDHGDYDENYIEQPEEQPEEQQTDVSDEQKEHLNRLVRRDQKEEQVRQDG